MNTKFDGAGIAIAVADRDRPIPLGQAARMPSLLGSTAKRLVDIVCGILGLAVIAIAGAVLWAANPIWNPGPLFFCQTRMGKDCKPFTAIKFRTMREAHGPTRGPDDPLEHDRITALGRLLRRTRLDEMPQVINILRGEMSLIGPRPDYWPHAVAYVERVPGYRERHRVKPGITGLAQVSLGYAEGVEATFRKVRYDLAYL
ncbi:MAG: sugar transferase, partial [Thermohalobaculum sp.]|nr:sugar transferase [Thermohalobaculum sp.]